jgi:2-polyprenyl-3-methyl-5-hydroxy-6-metoxy-1,4-benzoquinol methylase
MERLKRVGREVSAADYWRERSLTYNNGICGSYHNHRLKVIKRLLKDINLPGTKCIDFGCGDGVMMEFLTDNGAHVVGLDPVEEMVLAVRTRGNYVVTCGGVTALRTLDTGAFGCLFALNVLAYLSKDEEKLFYREAHRLLRKGGSLVVTHSNELFDMFTLNRLTVEFYLKHFCPEHDSSKVSSLLTNPLVPERIVFNIRENPLSYRYKLAEYQFSEVQQEFINFHPIPPLLMDQNELRNIDSREYRETLDWPEEERWKLMFMCSMFGSRALRD